ncbi:MAG TPA: 3-deoxy-D-manno-octulosonic acid transferase [Candidatus Polarisedimenticolia bacterium]|nr:3-deoxy-D-manno-octulosonic acid transferase [Candidatus Polarisedimenticolia bacterium]
MIALAYHVASDLAAPLLRRHVVRRVAAGKEERTRLNERFGIASLARPAGRLAWLHGASVGETQSLLVLIEALHRREPGLNFLVTSGTVTSARLLAQRQPVNTLHQYLPLDRRTWAARFLDHWRPDFALWVESEFWPNLLDAARRRGVPLALVNGRLSAKSLARWRWAPSLIRPVVEGFRVVLAQDEAQAQRLAALGARAPQSLGNLKFAAAPLAADAAQLAALVAATAGRTVWLAASTHTGEEAIIATAHRTLKARWPNLLTVIAPRHAERGEAIASELRAAGLSTARRSQNESIDAITDVYLADTLGELGLFYRLAKVVFVAGSFRWQGHNPIEPALLGSAVVSGPNVANFHDIFERMRKAAAVTIASEEELAGTIDQLLADPGPAGARAEIFARQQAEGILVRVVSALEPVVSPASVNRRAASGEN